MIDAPRQLTLDEWEVRYRQLEQAGFPQPSYGGPLARHLDEGDHRLARLRFDSSPAALRLWNFLLTEEDRLWEARQSGKTLIGTMKDLGTVPIIAYSLRNVVAFYPDGAWWLPCVMEFSTHLLEVADSLGVDDSFCPVRALLGAFVTGEHFPIPDLLTCSVGATCDDFSAVAERLEDLGHRVVWWEMPHRRRAQAGEEAVILPGGYVVARSQVDLVEVELSRVRQAIERQVGDVLDEAGLRRGIVRANEIRRCLARLRQFAYTAPRCPMPALEMLIAEMLAIHYCSDRDECLAVLEYLLAEVEARVGAGAGMLSEDAARIFWVNPVADLRIMNLIEQCGGRIAGTDYMLTHALDEIPEDVPPLRALAMTALADPMVGSAVDRAEWVRRQVVEWGAEAVVVSRIPGASHCALEGQVIQDSLDLPVLEIEVAPVCDAALGGLRTRLEALVETVRYRRSR